MECETSNLLTFNSLFLVPRLGHFKEKVIFTYSFTLVFRNYPRVVSYYRVAQKAERKYFDTLLTHFLFKVLCLLANFDDEHGVVGLGDAFPLVKAILGGIFAALFVICRAVMWSTISYYYCRDAWNVIKGSDPRKKGHELWFRYTFFSLSILSLLQIIWLGEIARVGHEELTGMGFI